jgi:hypothetical protein
MPKETSPTAKISKDRYFKNLPGQEPMLLGPLGEKPTPLPGKKPPTIPYFFYRRNVVLFDNFDRKVVAAAVPSGGCFSSKGTSVARRATATNCTAAQRAAATTPYRQAASMA